MPKKFVHLTLYANLAKNYSLNHLFTNLKN